jgi:hypothetical protein
LEVDKADVDGDKGAGDEGAGEEGVEIQDAPDLLDPEASVSSSSSSFEDDKSDG